MRVILLSIKPKYGFAILEGRKKYELRKCVNVRVMPGDLIIMYFSSPVKAIVGYFKAGKVFLASPEEIKNIISKLGDVGVDEEDFTYIDGFRRVMAIEVVEPRRCREVPLSRLRELNLRPPISYIALSEDIAQILLKECGIDLRHDERGQGDRGVVKEKSYTDMAESSEKVSRGKVCKKRV